ncbi:hypothetical protein M2323_004568 [Rhodoblastus acidophilus]|uniref:hypothetical protein n=1 Tax=Rhodoblastus acidophilus TaxID=1074 RepID=UPI002224EAB7|nr:hypothetical protein [Rhodoblastus acidophilus]MCW2286779.1 hypothetical protein [Rhodoblastus acidophilus]MCW2335617.1 hypothetical protein [Rhodoblastus acidophilus]
MDTEQASVVARLAEISASGFVTLHKPIEPDDLRRTLDSLLAINDRAPSDSAPGTAL